MANQNPKLETQNPITRPLAKLPGDGLEAPGFEAEHLARLMAQLPPDLRNSQEWRALLLVFLNVPRLRQLTGTYIDLPAAEVDVTGFWDRMFGYLSSTETFLATLAFHLYNPANALPPSGLLTMRHLDRKNFELAVAAIRVAFM